jgi:hypothetical protein
VQYGPFKILANFCTKSGALILVAFSFTFICVYDF